MSDIQYGPHLRIAEFKSGDDGHEVAGYVSTYGNLDHGGDVVMRGAFDTCLAAKGKVRFLFGHKTDQVLGVPLELKSDDSGLFGRFKISQTQLGRDIHTLLKDGALDSFSIGYIPTDIEYDDAGARLLKSIDLLECSVVAMPMNERATVTAVKAENHQKTDRKPSENWLDIDEDVPFEELFVQVKRNITLATEAAEALQARRLADKRKLTVAQIDAIKAFLDQAEADFERLLRVAQPPPSPQLSDGMKLRLELARRLEGHRALETN